MNHFADPHFWRCYRTLPPNIQRLADENFELMKRDFRHPSLRLKKVGRYWAARVGANYRTLAVENEQGLIWFWIGTHSDYERMVR